MRFAVLGPLEAWDGDRPVALAGGRARALLARLLLDPGRTVSVGTLLADLWGEDPPETATKMVQIQVSHLRKHLPGGVLRTRPPGYELAVDAADVDLGRFETLAASGRGALDAGDPARAAAELAAALALWRGPALAEFTEPFAVAAAARLEEARVACLEDRIAADLALGRHTAVTGELEILIAAHPVRERLREHQVLALYRAGRQAEALAAYAGFRAALDEELGLEPSARLRDLQRRVLQQDPSLDLAPAPRREPGPVRYTTNGGVALAYQVVGDGPVDLVVVHGWICSFAPGWEWPAMARFYDRLAGMGRLILFDRRGVGLSDRVQDVPPLEVRMDDVRAVMDAAGSERAVLVGISGGGGLVTLFAATHPERTVALVGLGIFARRSPAPGYPIAIPGLDVSHEQWGLPLARAFLAQRAPSIAGDPEAEAWYASYFVRSASPGAARAVNAMADDTDVRAVLPAVRVPTFLAYRRDEYLAPAAQYLAERIAGAHVRVVDGADHLPWEGDRELLLDEIEAFLAGVREGAGPRRVLGTVLVARAVAPDAAALVARFHGTGAPDPGGTLCATFDGPARAVRCARALAEAGAAAGVDTGALEPGAPARGPAVDAATTLAAAAAPGEVLATTIVRDLTLGAGLSFAAHGDVLRAQ